MKTFDISKTANKKTLIMDWYGDLHEQMPESPRYYVVIDISMCEYTIRTKLIKAINNQ